MKQLIALTVHLIETEELTKQMITAMPDLKNPEKRNSFINDMAISANSVIHYTKEYISSLIRTN